MKLKSNLRSSLQMKTERFGEVFDGDVVIVNNECNASDLPTHDSKLKNIVSR